MIEKLSRQWNVQNVLGSYITRIASISTKRKSKKPKRFSVDPAAVCAIKSMEAEIGQKLLCFDDKDQTIGVPQHKYHELLKKLVAAKSL